MTISDISQTNQDNYHRISDPIHESSGDVGYLQLTHHEDDLINQRLTWLIASQSLLFTGYAVLVATGTGRLASNATMWLPVLGVSMAAIIWVGTLGAVVARLVLHQRLRRRRHGHRLLGVHWVTTAMGWTPGVLLPILFLLTWVMLMP